MAAIYAIEQNWTWEESGGASNESAGFSVRGGGGCGGTERFVVGERGGVGAVNVPYPAALICLSQLVKRSGRFDKGLFYLPIPVP